MVYNASDQFIVELMVGFAFVYNNRGWNSYIDNSVLHLWVFGLQQCFCYTDSPLWYLKILYN